MNNGIVVVRVVGVAGMVEWWVERRWCLEILKFTPKRVLEVDAKENKSMPFRLLPFFLQTDFSFLIKYLQGFVFRRYLIMLLEICFQQHFFPRLNAL